MIICLKNVFIHQHNFEDTQKMHKPKRIPPWQIMTVKIRARVGSPRFDDTANGRKNGMTSSLAMACNKRGAPVRLCRPAPSVDKNDPIRITHSLGQAMLATTNFPPIDAPNLFSIFVKFHLKNTRCITVTYLSRNRRLSTVPANRRTDDKYTVLVVKMAAIVPIGILFCASAKSPERFEPAIIPVRERRIWKSIR